MSRPLPALLVFLAISMAIVGLSQGSEDELRPKEEGNLSGDQKTLRSDVEDPGTLETTFDAVWCTVTLGGAEIFFDACSDALRGSQAIFGTNPVTEAVLTVTDSLDDFVSIVGSVLTFNVPGAPGWVRWAIGLPITGTIFYVVVSLVRGAG